jgi:hypothetical protein
MLQINKSEDFEELASCLINEYTLNACDLDGKITCFNIVEIEFYLQSLIHPDMYVHARLEQLTIGKFYFHRTSGGGAYKAGTFKGLDVTFAHNAYGGILLRSLTSGGVLIEGPCNCVNEILKVTQSNDIAALVKRLPCDYTVFDNSVLWLALRENRKLPVYMCRRIGLNATKCPRYIDAPYRYLSDLRIKKDREGIAEGMKEHHAIDCAEMIHLRKLANVNQ